MENNFFFLVVGIGNDTSPANFGTGARGGWHRDNGSNGIGIGPAPPVTNVLEIPYRPGLTRHEGHHFAQIQPGAAAEGNHPVMMAGFERRNTRREILLGGVGVS